MNQTFYLTTLMKRFSIAFILCTCLPTYADLLDRISQNRAVWRVAQQNRVNKNNIHHHLNLPSPVSGRYMLQAAIETNDSALAHSLYKEGASLFAKCSDGKTVVARLREQITNDEQAKRWNWVYKIVGEYVLSRGAVATPNESHLLYAFNEQCKKEPPSHQSIPKIMHQIWIGPHPVPKHLLKFSKEWKRMHPDWEYKLWTNEDLKTFKFRAKKAFKHARNWGQKADILRYEILEQMGGVYLDIDFICIKPLDELHTKYDFYCSRMFADKISDASISNGVIASRPHHPIMKNCVDRLIRSRVRNHEGVWRILYNTGPWMFTDVVMDAFVQSQEIRKYSAILPYDTFFAYPSNTVSEWKANRLSFETIKKNFVTPNTYGIHLWASTWM